MSRRKTTMHIHTILGCFALGCTGATFAASGIPTLGDHIAHAGVERQPAFMQQVAPRLLRESDAEFRFRHFADLFLTDGDDQPPGGLAANVTAAIFGDQIDPPGGRFFGGGGPASDPGNRRNGNDLTFGITGSALNGPVAQVALGGGGGGVGGGGGGGGGGIGGGGENNGGVAGNGAGNGNGGNNGNGDGVITFSDDPPNCNGHDGGCCCCAAFRLTSRAGDDPERPSFTDGGSGNGGGHTAAIPVPPSLWIGIIGLAAVGWMRQRRVAP